MIQTVINLYKLLSLEKTLNKIGMLVPSLRFSNAQCSVQQAHFMTSSGSRPKSSFLLASLLPSAFAKSQIWGISVGGW